MFITASRSHPSKLVQMDSTHHLFTLGYEGLDISTFIERARAAGVKTVVDVRELPLSRKKGFSKSSFRDALAEAGIAYAHIPALGCPKEVRERYKADGSWATYTRGFLAYLETQQSTVNELVKIANATTACLVCFESDFTMCHRTYVARAARTKGGPVVVHLTSRTSFPDVAGRLAA
ncbi:DUF488 domain-containing protein [Hydrogenophaga laconesensis]|uniref:Uncharacterized protein (DUF488 family) n=1 Tax=Hydrogenophaga laconesensis TaxID=1805971 RepID=A0ABU1VGI8_9BURK|nr:DUF488 domain-containing protein [Hydrogenophaga laconesensis]MDR7096581.1 uncharacterized protein (DUF488 family) [Hydrogenophaga laconesensis]